MRKESKLKRLTFSYNGKHYDVYGTTDKELQRKRTEKIEALKRGELIVCSSMTVRAWAEQCVETYKTNLSDKALKKYKYFLSHYILEEIGDLKLKDVKPLTCQKALNKLEGLSVHTIGYVHQIMTFIFQKAVDNELINKNPAKNITRPQGTSYKHRRAFTPYEEEMFLKAIKTSPHELLFLLMYGCGCRPSEARNVEGRDIITRNDRLYLHIRGTKTANADRYVPIPEIVEEALPEHIEPFRKLCVTRFGEPINEQCCRRAWKSIERQMNIEMGCRVYRNQLIPPYPLGKDVCSYMLRHTYCTNLQKRGIDVRTAQYLMGHADITMTANIYTHTQIEYLDNIYDNVVGDAPTNEEERTLRVAHLK